MTKTESLKRPLVADPLCCAVHVRPLLLVGLGSCLPLCNNSKGYSYLLQIILLAEELVFSSSPTYMNDDG